MVPVAARVQLLDAGVAAARPAGTGVLLVDRRQDSLFWPFLQMLDAAARVVEVSLLVGLVAGVLEPLLLFLLLGRLQVRRRRRFIIVDVDIVVGVGQDAGLFAVNDQLAAAR